MIRVNTDARERPASRNGIAVLRAAACMAGLAAGLGAQSPAVDSLADRLRRAEAAIVALQVQIAEQAQSGVKSRSGAQIQLSGRVMVNAFHNGKFVNNVDNPQFVLPDPGPSAGPFDPPARGLGMAIRQTRLGLIFTVPETMGGGSFTGDIDVDFYGGQQPSSGGRTFPLLRLRTAHGTVRWPGAHLLIGQESPLVSGLNPISPTAIGTPAFAAAGNLWLWLPQVRAGLTRGSRMRVGVTAAVLAPTSGDPASAFDTDFDLAERTSHPFLQGRAHLGWGQEERAAELGCGVHHGWLASSATTRVRSLAIACDARVPLYSAVELRGEFFKGQALRGLGGGGIGQNLTPANDPLHATGGWAQLNLRASATAGVGAGCGVDHPNPLVVRRRNESCAAYVNVRPLGPMFFAVELRRLRTEYTTGRRTNDHVTLAAGFEF